MSRAQISWVARFNPAHCNTVVFGVARKIGKVDFLQVELASPSGNLPARQLVEGTGLD
jgi:hypothetical protein